MSKEGAEEGVVQREVSVDPMVTSCVALIHNDAAKVEYRLVMPTVGSALSHYSGPLLEMGEWSWQYIASVAESVEMTTTLKDAYTWILANIHFLSRPLAAMPLYPCMWVLASALLSVEHDFAASAVTRYLAAALLGTFFAVVWVVFVLYRIGNQLLQSQLPFLGSWLSGGMTAAVFGASLLLTMERVQALIVDNIFLFWSDRRHAIYVLYLSYHLM